jgi:hypothetical protein
LIHTIDQCRLIDIAICLAEQCECKSIQQRGLSTSILANDERVLLAIQIILCERVSTRKKVLVFERLEYNQFSISSILLSAWQRAFVLPWINFSTTDTLA